jgi:hypothetical protein
MSLNLTELQELILRAIGLLSCLTLIIGLATAEVRRLDPNGRGSPKGREYVAAGALRRRGRHAPPSGGRHVGRPVDLLPSSLTPSWSVLSRVAIVTFSASVVLQLGNLL